MCLCNIFLQYLNLNQRENRKPVYNSSFSEHFLTFSISLLFHCLFLMAKLFLEVPRCSCHSFECLQMVITDQVYLSQKYNVELLTLFYSIIILHSSLTLSIQLLFT